MVERSYKSIGEVLGLLLEEFPNVTISKIRFLESQGLIEPERTASGYRKFSDAEVERLRYILREQETNYLPLRVIRDRLDESGSLVRDATNSSSQLPRALRESSVVDVSEELPRVRVITPAVSFDETGDIEIVDESVTRASERVHPAARRSSLRPSAASFTEGTGLTEGTINTSTGRLGAASGLMSHQELLLSTGLSSNDVALLEQYGLISSAHAAGETLYDSAAQEVCALARAFLDQGIEIRHLKSWRLAAEREAALFEQRLLPLLRQRNPAAREQSTEILDSLLASAGALRNVLVRQAVEKFLDPR